MNKKELVGVIVEKTGMKAKDVESVINAFTSTVKEKVATKETVRILGFGTFLARESAKRKGVNPQTGKTITIPACVRPAFRAGTSFREAVNVKPAKKKKK